MAFDSREFRNALGGFVTGVTVVTTRAPDGMPIGITANSFNSVSLDPPLVLFSLDRRAYSLAAFVAAQAFAIHVLADGQGELSRIFARALADKWTGIDFETWATGTPILVGALARFECRTHAIHEGGDHLIFVGEVLRFDHRPEARPLAYFRGAYAKLAE